MSYDRQVAKGPGFGTNFTLACPYTLLAHYTELEWAAVILHALLGSSFAYQFGWDRLFVGSGSVECVSILREDIVSNRHLLMHGVAFNLAQECGVEASLVRVWVGLDPQEHLLQVFGKALDAAADAVYNNALP